MRRDTFTQTTNKRINKTLLPPSWHDDDMHLSDNDPMVETADAFHEPSMVDANGIDSYNEFIEHPVYDRDGHIKGYRTEVVGKKKKKRSLKD